MLTSRRDAFDIPREVAYLNAAYMGPLSRRVVEEGRRGLERKMQPWNISAPDFFDPVETVRELFARLIAADAEGVAILPSVSYGIAVAANNLKISSRERIVLIAEEFPSNVYAWLDLAERTGAEVVTVPRPVGGDWTTAIIATIDDRTKIVAVPNCHWTDGGFIELIRVAARTHEVGAALVIDATQSIGAMPLDVERVRPEFLITAAYKWLLGPYGAAFMWCAPDARHGRPLELGWIARRGSADFAHLVDYERELREGGRRYDVGETSNFAMIPALHAALEQALEWGVEGVCRYSETLVDSIAGRAETLGLGVAPKSLRAPHLIGLHIGDRDPQTIAHALSEANVHVSVRGSSVRVSPHVYNDEQDVDRLFEALERAL